MKSGSVIIKHTFCITVLIREMFNVRLMLNMLRINVKNTIRAKARTVFCLSRGDVARVLIIVYYNTQIMAQICTYREISVQ